MEILFLLIFAIYPSIAAELLLVDGSKLTIGIMGQMCYGRGVAEHYVRLPQRQMRYPSK